MFERRRGGEAAIARRARGVVALLCGVATTAWLAAPPAPASAHPHQFVDITANLVLDDAGRLISIRAAFKMDETESLYIASEFGLDPDGPLTPEQSQFVFKAYAKGYTQFNWFTHLRQSKEALPIGPPTEGAAQMKDGALTIEWSLPLKRPIRLDAAPILLQFYDPTFYAATYMLAAPTVTGPGADRCDVVLARFEPTEELKRLAAVLALLPPDATPEDPTVGRLFADRMEASCDDGPGEG